jgi:hypothetical protein
MKYITRLALASVPSRFADCFGYMPSRLPDDTPLNQPALHEKMFTSAAERAAWIDNALRNGFEKKIGSVTIHFPPNSILYVETEESGSP